MQIYIRSLIMPMSCLAWPPIVRGIIGQQFKGIMGTVSHSHMHDQI